MIKYIIISLLLIYSSLGFAQTAQVTSTGNLIDPNAWNGAIYMTPQQLSQVEGTGGGPIPAFNTGTNTIRFSFMPYTVSQIQAINAAMFNNNTNIQVSGYNYSWKLYGNNGFLNVLGKLYDTNGSVLEQASYNYQFSPAMPMNWDQISGSSNFSTPYNFKTLGSMEFSVTGQDGLFWSGYYGPRIRDINISFNYSLLPPPTTPSIPTSKSNVTTDIIAEVTSATTTEPTTQTVAQSTPVVETNNVSASSVITTSTTTTQPVVAAVQTTKESISSPQSTQQSTSQTSSAPSLTSVLSMIQTNQARENTIAQTAVAQANQVAQQAVKEAEQTAVATAMASSSQSMENSKESIRSETKDNKAANTNSGIPLVALTSSSVATINPIQSQSVTALQAPTISQQIMPGQQSSSNVVNAMANITIQPVINSSITNTQQQNNIEPAQTVNTMTTARTDLYSLLPPVPVVQEVITPQQPSLPVNNNISAFTTETPSNSSSFFTNRADPLQDYVEKNSIMVALSQPEIRPSTVRTNVQDSTLAGNVRVERLQVVPNGYNMYLSFILRDAAFYESKEIYKNNALRDNARTMYFIEKGNTDTFNKMIEMQYK